jgi:hypothetical protein
MRTATAALGSAHAFLHHLANVRRRATLLAPGLLHPPTALRSPGLFHFPGGLQFLATLVGVSFRAAFSLGVSTLTGATLFVAVCVARGHSSHPDQQGSRHSNYLV